MFSNISHVPLAMGVVGAINLTMASADRVMVGFTVPCCLLSLFGCATIAYVFWAYLEVRTTSRKILVYLSIANALACLGNLIRCSWFVDVASVFVTGYGKVLLPGGDGVTVPILASAVITSFAEVSSSLWTIFLGIYLYLCIVWNRFTLANRLVWLFHCLTWGLAITVTATMLTNFAVGYDPSMVNFRRPSWEFLTGNITHRAPWVFALGEGWKIATYFFGVSFGIVMCINVMKEKREEDINAEFETVAFTQKSSRKLTMIPLLFIMLRMWSTVRILFILYNREHLDKFMWLVDLMLVMQGILDSSQGFVNALILCIGTKRIRRKLFRKLGWYFTCRGFYCRRSGPSNNYSTVFRTTTLHDDSLSRASEENISMNGAIPMRRIENAPMLT